MRDVLGSRFLASAGLLGGLVILNVVAGSAFAFIVAVALVIAPSICWAATYYFTKRSKANPSIKSLRERAQTSFLLAIVSTTGAVLGAIVVLRELSVIAAVPRDIFLVGLAFALILVAGPALNGLVTWQPWKPEPDEPS